MKEEEKPYFTVPISFIISMTRLVIALTTDENEKENKPTNQHKFPKPAAIDSLL